jgi:predicted  nucleic acid-binding Zn-ribbon protein
VEQLKVEKKLARELEASTRTRNDTVMKKYKDSQLALLTATEQAKDAMHSLQNLTAQNKDLMSDLAELKTLSQNNTKKAIDNESKWQNVKDDYDFLKQKSASELKDLHEQVVALSRDRAEVEDELRKEFGKQLKDILRDRQNQFEADKTAGLEALRKAFEEKNAARADELLAAVKENDKLANRVVALEDDLAEAEQQAQKAQGEVAASQRQIEVMQIQVHKANDRHQTQVRDLVATVEAGKEARIKKQKDFDDLVDVNVTLEMEIKAYRLLIENEENRLGLD